MRVRERFCGENFRVRPEAGCGLTKAQGWPLVRSVREKIMTRFSRTSTASALAIICLGRPALGATGRS